MMGVSALARLREEVAAALRDDPRFGGIRIQGEFAGGPRDFPVREPLLCVGIGSVELTHGGIGAMGGENSPPMAAVSLRFDCWIPRERELSSYLIEDLYDALLALGVRKLEGEQIQPDPAAMATRLCVRAELPVLLDRPDERREIREIIVQRAIEN